MMISRRLLRPAASLLALASATVLFAACDSDSPTDRLSIVPPTNTIGPAGGEVDLGSGVTLRVPAGAVSQPTEFGVSVTDASAGVTDSYRSGSIYSFEPAGLSFMVPVEVSIPTSSGGQGLLVVTLDGSEIVGLERGRVVGSRATGGLRQLGPVWVSQRGDIASRINLGLDLHELQAGDVLSLDLRVENAAGGLLDPALVSVESSDPEIATVEVVGEELIVTALTQGVTTIVAALHDASASLTVTVSAGDVAALEIDPSAAELPRRDTLQLAVRALDSEGNETRLPRSIVWSSSDQTVARVNQRGQVVAYGGGVARIVAKSGQAIGEAMITVPGPIPSDLRILPRNPVVGQGQTRPLTAQTLDEFGEVIEEGAPAVSWSSEDESIATVDADGQVTGVRFGQTSIIATSANVGAGADTVTLTVGTGVPYALQIVTQPAGFIPGYPFLTQPVVRIVDEFGNEILEPGITIQATLGRGDGSVTGTTELETDDQGVVRFTDLALTDTDPASVIFLAHPLQPAESAILDPLEPMELVFDFYPCLTLTLPFDDLGEPWNVIVVDWGDGDIEGFEPGESIEHFSYLDGEHTVRVYGSARIFGSYYDGYWSGYSELLRVDSWGDIGLTQLPRAFQGAYQLYRVPSTLPPGVTDLSNTFREATIFNQDLSRWDVSNVRSMYQTFEEAESFNQNLSDWDLSRVVDMEDMFTRAYSFNNGCDVGDTSCPLTWGSGTRNVQNMEGIFDETLDFNQSVSDWNVSSATNFDDFFKETESFNNGCSEGEYTCPLPWGSATSDVEDMDSMFEDADVFNQSVASWNVSSARDMNEMFQNAVAFNNGCAEGVFSCPLSWGQTTANVGNMSEMFEGAESFNQNVGGWNLTRVTTVSEMFREATAFNNGCAAGIETCAMIWTDDGTLAGEATTDSISTMYRMFETASAFNQPVGHWNTSGATSMNQMFQHAEIFDQPLNDWNVSSVTTMNSMFDDAAAFDQELSSWSVNAVTDMAYMFLNAVSFDRDISNWCVSQITTEPSNFSSGTDAWDGQPAGVADSLGRPAGALYWGEPDWGTCPGS
jgi:uncharacterized protein YjdB